MTELEALILLNSVPQLGNSRLRRLLDHFGSAHKVLSCSQKELMREGNVSTEIVQQIYQLQRNEPLRDELSLVKKHGVHLITIHDEGYPKYLKEIDDAPVLLYVKGKLSDENNTAIAMVGSRLASLYGLTIAEKFSSELAQFGIIIVSGLAKGIDTAAHRGALKVSGRTIAVLGSGLANVYPVENEKLFEAIVEYGAIISEFPMTMPPLTHNFPRRNRVISGLSLGVVVVEASKKSGALITAQFALEQGREVFAVPGKVDNPNSLGAHSLIQNGAKLVTTTQDILEELALPIQLSLPKETKKADTIVKEELHSLTSEELEVYDSLGKEAQHIDELVELTGKSIGFLTKILLQLELKGLVEQQPGQFFVRINRKRDLSKTYV